MEFHRIIGTGQFGLVRLVRNTKTNDVYALKVRVCVCVCVCVEGGGRGCF